MKTLRFIDLFAGLGGTRIGFENACKNNMFNYECVFSSEIKPYAVKVYKENFNESSYCDITKVNSKDIPNFDYLLAGFPCQSFSSAGLKQGFNDVRGNLFFDIIRILKDKSPRGFLLENVDALLVHDKGKTFNVIKENLVNLGYDVVYSIYNSKDFGIPQNRKRLYIWGTKNKNSRFEIIKKEKKVINDILEDNIENDKSAFIDYLLKMYPIDFLIGKSIKDKRGGHTNIHSWDLNLKGETTTEQKRLLNMLLKKRRLKKWAINKGINWMDGMPLTYNEISTFYYSENLLSILNDLTNKGYLKYEHPKELITVNGIKKRVYAKDKEKGYNIVAGKLSFPIARILDPFDICPTLVATEVGKYVIPTTNGLRRFTIREGLRLAGFPDSYKLDFLSYDEAFDLLGNTITPIVVESILDKVIKDECN